MSIPDFIAGFVYGMTGDNKLTEIEACFQGFEIMQPEIELGIADLKKGGWNNDIQAALQFGLVATQVPQALSTCENMDEDLAAIESWAQIFTNPVELASTVSKRFVLHHHAIENDISSLTTDWEAASYFTAGEDLANLLTDAVGPISTSLTMRPNMVPDMMSGWFQGMFGPAPF